MIDCRQQQPFIPGFIEQISQRVGDPLTGFRFVERLVGDTGDGFREEEGDGSLENVGQEEH